MKDPLLGKLLRLIAERYLLSNRPLSSLFISSSDYLSLQIVLDGYYEFTLLKIISSNLSAFFPSCDLSSSLFIDVGANIGNHTVFLSPFFAQTISFEPNPITYRLLCLNTAAYTNIKTVNLGLSDSLCTAKLYGSTDHLGGWSLQAQSSYKTLSPQTIDLDTLDHYLSSLGSSPPVSFLKIDIEGHELKAFKGMKQTLCKSKPLILFEQHSSEFRSSSSDCLDFLSSIGYTYYYIAARSYRLTLLNFISKYAKSSLFQLILRSVFHYDWILEPFDVSQVNVYANIFASTTPLLTKYPLRYPIT